MPAALTHISPNTPMGVNLVEDGATFRVWAPEALEVYACGTFNNKVRDDSSLLTRDANGYWAGFLPGVKDGDRYKFWVKGKGSEGWKRDPYARELAIPWPSDCIVRSPDFPWHETGYATPRYEDFAIYQLHVGTFYSPRWPEKAGTFLDVIDRIPHLSSLGITALQLLPIAEFQTAFSKGYNGTDYFSPEMDFAVDPPDLPAYLARINAMLAARGLAPYQLNDLRQSSDQLKALVDLCHVHGLAVIFDVVYNHAGGDFGDESLYFFDRRQDQNAPDVDLNESQYFIDRGHAGGLVFAFWKREVRQFLIDNARFLREEYRIDGLRYDQVSVMTQDGGDAAWPSCQELSSTVRFLHAGSLQNAEFWPVNPDVVKPARENGAGFDTTLTDGLRIAIRRVIEQASYPGDHPVDMTSLGSNLWPGGFQTPWSFVQGPENHDLVYRGREDRIPRLADKSDARSWYARSRARVAFGLAFTAPGIPMLFMGQEFLEDKPWADDLSWHSDLRLFWDGLDSDPAMQGFLRFARDVIRLRFQEPALRGAGLRTVHAHEANRVLAFHRWVPGEGRDVMVVVSLANFNQFNYRIGFPWPGVWQEVFNSDAYDFGPAVGNAGTVFADSVPLHGYDYSASLTLPANSVLVFRR